LVKWRTQQAIEVSTPRRCRSLAADDGLNRLRREIVVRDRRDVGRATYHGIPTVPREQIVLDIAATTGDLQLVRFVLAQLDFMRCLNVPALQRLRGRGVPGSALLGQAIATHQPLLARARSVFEIKLIYVCELTGIPLPEVNEKIGEITPDAVWRDQMVVVGCDGEGNHGTWAQRKRDLNEDRILRGLGYFPIRYTYEQLEDPWAIHADLMPILEERRGRAARLAAA
jgi:very-short-patch-repair endonuclease